MKRMGLMMMVAIAALAGCQEEPVPSDPDLAAAHGLSLAQVIDTFEPAIAGKVAFHRRNCMLCHSIKGSQRVGPSLNTIYGTERVMTDGTRVLADDDYLRESIALAPKQVVKGYRGDMPRYDRVLEPGEVEVLVAYIKSLPAPADP